MQRHTKQRQAIAQALEKQSRFRSAQEIHQDLAAAGHNIGLATVYRNLQALAADHAVDVVRSPEGEALYRSCVEEGHHHHLVCRNCGRTEEFALGPLESQFAKIASQHGYTNLAHSVELFGLCQDCS